MSAVCAQLTEARRSQDLEYRLDQDFACPGSHSQAIACAPSGHLGPAHSCALRCHSWPQRRSPAWQSDRLEMEAETYIAKETAKASSKALERLQKLQTVVALDPLSIDLASRPACSACGSDSSRSGGSLDSRTFSGDEIAWWNPGGMGGQEDGYAPDCPEISDVDAQHTRCWP